MKRGACVVFLVGEGPNDIGDLADHPSYRDGREGFLQPLLRRLAPEHRLELDGQKIATLPRKPVGRAVGHGRKAGQALALAGHAGADALVFVKDTDGAPGSVPSVRTEIEQGFSEARERDPELGDLVALCATPSPMIEAWALGDPAALAAHAGEAVAHLRHRNPETLTGDERDPGSNHPKRVLERALGRRATSADFAALAESADLTTLRRNCPQSFPPFADSVATAAKQRESLTGTTGATRTAGSSRRR